MGEYRRTPALSDKTISILATGLLRNPHEQVVNCPHNNAVSGG